MDKVISQKIGTRLQGKRKVYLKRACYNQGHMTTLIQLVHKDIYYIHLLQLCPLGSLGVVSFCWVHGLYGSDKQQMPRLVNLVAIALGRVKDVYISNRHVPAMGQWTMKQEYRHL